MGASFVFIIVRQHDQSYRGNIDIVKEPYSTHDLKYLMWIASALNDITYFEPQIFHPLQYPSVNLNIPLFYVGHS